MEYIAGLKRNNEIGKVTIKMVVQRENYMEMPQFVKLGKHWNVDMVYFTKIWEGGIYSTPEKLKEVSMINEDGTLKKELHDVMKNPILNDAIVYMTFK